MLIGRLRHTIIDFSFRGFGSTLGLASVGWLMKAKTQFVCLHLRWETAKLWKLQQLRPMGKRAQQVDFLEEKKKISSFQLCFHTSLALFVSWLNLMLKSCVRKMPQWKCILCSMAKLNKGQMSEQKTDWVVRDEILRSCKFCKIQIFGSPLPMDL